MSMLAELLHGTAPKTPAAAMATRRVCMEKAKARTEAETNAAAHVLAALWSLGAGAFAGDAIRTSARIGTARITPALLLLQSEGVIKSASGGGHRKWSVIDGWMPDVCQRLAGVPADLRDLLRKAGEFYAAKQTPGEFDAIRNPTLRRLAREKRNSDACAGHAARLAEIAFELAKMGGDYRAIGVRAAQKLHNLSRGVSEAAELIARKGAA